MKNIYVFIFLFVACMNPLLLDAQSQQSKLEIQKKTQTAQLRNFADSWHTIADSNRRKAELTAQLKGWPIKGDLPDGGYFELQRLDKKGKPVYNITANENAAKTISTNKLYAGGGLGLSLTGNGFLIGEWDGGKVRITHQEFGGRATLGDNASTLNGHSTHVAGTLIASGVTTAAKGMAFQANLKSYDWNYDAAEMSIAASNGLLLSNHSYISIAGWYYSSPNWYWYGDTTISTTEDYTFGLYDQTSRIWDIISYNAPYYLIVKAAGNEKGEGPNPGTSHLVWNGENWVSSSATRPKDGGTQGYDCLPTYSVAKNILTVANVNDIVAGYNVPGDVTLISSSSFGPADDGRIKPDISANGASLYSTYSPADNAYTTMTGTSMASPSVCGSLALLQQHFYNQNGHYMKSATLKALTIHTADEAGTANGPDYRFGWGLMNSAKAATLISRNDSLSMIRELSLDNGHTYSLEVYSDGIQPLIATIAWTDPAGTPVADSLNPKTLMLVNDLDLRISKSPVTWTPWILDPANPANTATNGDNFRDNVEKIDIENPTAGIYTITVSHKSVLQNGSQEFELIVSGITENAPKKFSASALSSDSVCLVWERKSSFTTLLAWSSTPDFGKPQNGVSYQNGNTLPGGGTVLYTGSDTIFLHTQLSQASKYYYRIWSITNGTPDYSTFSSSDAQTECKAVLLPYTESFNGSSFSPCWSQQNLACFDGWEFWNTNISGGNGGEAGRNWEYVDGIGVDGLAAKSRLITAPLNTSGITAATLRFKTYYEDHAGWGGNGATMNVQSSTDLINWNNESWSVQSDNGNYGPQTVSVNISQNLNSPNTYFAFTIEGNPYHIWYWAVDDITLTGPSGIWSGKSSTNWNDTANWVSYSVPNTSTDVSLLPAAENNPHITSAYNTPAQANNLTIPAGKSLILDSAKALTINGILTNNAGVSGIVLNNASSLIHSTSNVPMTLQRYFTANNWHLIASPFAANYGTSLTHLMPPAGLGYLRTYVNGSAWGAYLSDTSNQLNAGKGYALWVTQSFTASLSGNIQAAPITQNLTFSTNGYNLIGNPFSSYLDLNQAQRTNTNSTFYFWEEEYAVNNGGNFRTWNTLLNIGTPVSTTSVIAPLQGFFAEANLSPATVQFPASGCVHANQSFYKTSPAIETLIRIKAENAKGQTDETLLALNPAATDGSDEGDSRKFSPNAENYFEIYSRDEDAQKLVIQNRTTKASVIPLDFSTSETGLITIYPPVISGKNIRLMLADVQTNINTDLSSGNYQFMATKGVTQNRLFLHLIPESSKSPESIVFADANSIHVYFSQLKSGRITLYDISGKKVLQQGIASQSYLKLSPNIPKGIYLLQIIYNDGTTETLKVVKP